MKFITGYRFILCRNLICTKGKRGSRDYFQSTLVFAVAGRNGVYRGGNRL